jgi:glyoxylate/hydroxypyruvate reductase A
MRHHMGLDRYVRKERPLTWFAADRPLPDGRAVGVLGLGRLGRDAAEMLARLRFEVLGWSRTPKQAEGATCLHGADGLREILRRSEILVILLPLTAQTRGLLDADALALLPQGAAIVNAGRGPILPEAGLLAALDAGALSHATLDVFDREPLPDGHPYLSHPNVTVTPHIASATRPETAAEALIAQIARGERGQPFENVVDRALGY